MATTYNSKIYDTFLYNQGSIDTSADLIGTNKWISIFYKRFFPDRFFVEYPKFMNFFRYYLEHMESSKNPYWILAHMSDLMDLEKTFNECIYKFRDQYVPDLKFEYIPESDKRQIILNIKDFYSKKGNLGSFEFLFRLIGYEIEIFNPLDHVLMVSDNTVIGQDKLIDSFYWTPFTYDIIVPSPYSAWNAFIRPLAHPSGMQMFGTYEVSSPEVIALSRLNFCLPDAFPNITLTDGEITTSDTSINAQYDGSTQLGFTNYPSSGSVVIGNDIVSYTSKDETTLYGLSGVSVNQPISSEITVNVDYDYIRLNTKIELESGFRCVFQTTDTLPTPLTETTNYFISKYEISSKLTTQILSGVSLLVVEDSSQFPYTGNIIVNGDVLEYDMIDYENHEISLTSGTTKIHPINSKVYLTDACFRLYETEDDFDNLNYVNLTDTGTGTHTFETTGLKVCSYTGIDFSLVNILVQRDVIFYPTNYDFSKFALNTGILKNFIEHSVTSITGSNILTREFLTTGNLFQTGDAIVFSNQTNGDLPTDSSGDLDGIYYWNGDGANPTIHYTVADALAGTNAIVVVDDGGPYTDFSLKIRLYEMYNKNVYYPETEYDDSIEDHTDYRDNTEVGTVDISDESGFDHFAVSRGFLSSEKRTFMYDFEPNTYELDQDHYSFINFTLKNPLTIGDGDTAGNYHLYHSSEKHNTSIAHRQTMVLNNQDLTLDDLEQTDRFNTVESRSLAYPVKYVSSRFQSSYSRMESDSSTGLVCRYSYIKTETIPSNIKTFWVADNVNDDHSDLNVNTVGHIFSDTLLNGGIIKKKISDNEFIIVRHHDSDYSFVDEYFTVGNGSTRVGDVKIIAENPVIATSKNSFYYKVTFNTDIENQSWIADNSTAIGSFSNILVGHVEQSSSGFQGIIRSRLDHKTYLTSDITILNTSIPVNSTVGFPNSGKIKIDNEEIIYKSKNSTNFLNCYRPNASIHLSGSTVVSNNFSEIDLRTIYIECSEANQSKLLTGAGNSLTVGNGLISGQYPMIIQSIEKVFTYKSTNGGFIYMNDIGPRLTTSSTPYYNTMFNNKEYPVKVIGYTDFNDEYLFVIMESDIFYPWEGSYDNSTKDVMFLKNFFEIDLIE